MDVFLMAGVHQQPDQSNYLAEGQTYTCKLLWLVFTSNLNSQFTWLQVKLVNLIDLGKIASGVI